MNKTEEKLVAPQGYEFDYFDESAQTVHWKPKENAPRSWIDFLDQHTNDMQHFIYEMGFINKSDRVAFSSFCKIVNIYRTWIGRWKPDWKDSSMKYVIESYEDKLMVYTTQSRNCILAFRTEDMARDFLETFRDLLEECKMFL